MLITGIANYIRKLQDIILAALCLHKIFQLIEYLVLKEANVEAYRYHSR